MIAGALLSACGEGSLASASVSAEETCRGLDVEVLRAIAYNYEPYDSLAEQQREGRQTAIVKGTVKGFLPGPELPVAGDPQYPDRYVLMEITVDQTLAGHLGELAPNGLMYVPVPQGPVYAVTRQPVNGVDDFAAAVPAGTVVVAFAGPAREDLAEAAELPGDAHLAGVGVQGLYLDDCGNLVGGFHDIPGNADWNRYPTLDALVTAIQG